MEGKLHCQISKKNNGNKPFKATKIWNDLITHLQANLESKRHRWKMHVYENCFKGTEIIDVLYHYVKNHPDLANNASRAQMKSLCQCLIDSKVFECVIGSEFLNKREGFVFEGGSKLYRFVANKPDHNSENVRENMPLRESNKVWLRAQSSRRRSVRFESTESSEAKENNVVAEWNRSRDRKRRSIAVVYKSALSTSPWKKRRKSLDSHFKVIPICSREDENGFGEENKDAYFIAALGILLRQLDIPFLEEILSASVMESSNNQSSSVISNGEDRLSQIDCFSFSYISSVVGLTREESDWYNSAMTCIKARNEFVLPCKKEIGYQNFTNLIPKASICESLTEYYASLLDSLIPSNFSTVVESIIKMWKAGRKLKVLMTLQLLMVLIPRQCCKHLQRLFCFIQKSLSCKVTIAGNNMQTRFMTRKFIGAVLPKLIRDKNAAEQLVTFMVDKKIQMFAVPESVKVLVNNYRSGVDDPAVPSTCQRISKAKYEQERKYQTHKSLVQLMNLVINDLQLSSKDKQQKLHLFEKHHPNVFFTQFPMEKR